MAELLPLTSTEHIQADRTCAPQFSLLSCMSGPYAGFKEISERLPPYHLVQIKKFKIVVIARTGLSGSFSGSGGSGAPLVFLAFPL